MQLRPSSAGLDRATIDPLSVRPGEAKGHAPGDAAAHFQPGHGARPTIKPPFIGPYEIIERMAPPDITIAAQ
jgi:hypothetical protein